MMKLNWTVYAAIGLLGVASLTGCGGRRATLVPLKQPNDPYLVCEQIYQEIKNNDTEIVNRIPLSDKKSQNLTYGIGGVFLLVPWLFMDISHAEQKEIAAYQNRNGFLRDLARRKHCTLSRLPNPVPVPENTVFN